MRKKIIVLLIVAIFVLLFALSYTTRIAAASVPDLLPVAPQTPINDAKISIDEATGRCEGKSFDMYPEGTVLFRWGAYDSMFGTSPLYHVNVYKTSSDDIYRGEQWSSTKLAQTQSTGAAKLEIKKTGNHMQLYANNMLLGEHDVYTSNDPTNIYGTLAGIGFGIGGQRSNHFGDVEIKSLNLTIKNELNKNLLETPWAEVRDGISPVEWSRTNKGIEITYSPGNPSGDKTWLYNLNSNKINQFQWKLPQKTKQIDLTAEIEWDTSDEAGNLYGGGAMLGGIGLVDENDLFYDFLGFIDGDASPGRYGTLGAVIRGEGPENWVAVIPSGKALQPIKEEWEYKSRMNNPEGRKRIKMIRDADNIKIYADGVLLKEHIISDEIRGISLGTSAHGRYEYGTFKIEKLELINGIEEIEDNNDSDAFITDLISVPWQQHNDGSPITVNKKEKDNGSSSIEITDSPSAPQGTQKEWLYDLDYARINQLQWFIDGGIPENAIVDAEIEWDSPDERYGGLTLGGIGFIDKEGFFHEFIGFNDGGGGHREYGAVGAVERDFIRNGHYAGEPWAFDSRQTQSKGSATLKLEKQGNHVKMYSNNKLLKEHDLQGSVAGIGLGTSGHLYFPFGTFKINKLTITSDKKIFGKEGRKEGVTDLLSEQWSWHSSFGSFAWNKTSTGVEFYDLPRGQDSHRSWLSDLDQDRIIQLKWIRDIPDKATIVAEISWGTSDYGMLLGGIGFVNKDGYFHEFVGINDGNAEEGAYGSFGTIVRKKKWHTEPKGTATLKLSLANNIVKMYINDVFVREYGQSTSPAKVALGTYSYTVHTFGNFVVKKLEINSTDYSYDLLKEPMLVDNGIILKNDSGQFIISDLQNYSSAGHEFLYDLDRSKIKQLKWLRELPENAVISADIIWNTADASSAGMLEAGIGLIDRDGLFNDFVGIKDTSTGMNDYGFIGAVTRDFEYNGKGELVHSLGPTRFECTDVPRRTLLRGKYLWEVYADFPGAGARTRSGYATFLYNTDTAAYAPMPADGAKNLWPFQFDLTWEDIGSNPTVLISTDPGNLLRLEEKRGCFAGTQPYNVWDINYKYFGERRVKLYNLAPAARYYWRIETTKSNGETALGPIWTFTTDYWGNVAKEPEPVYPDNPCDPSKAPIQPVAKNPMPEDQSHSVAESTTLSWQVKQGETVSDILFGWDNNINAMDAIPKRTDNNFYYVNSGRYPVKYRWLSENSIEITDLTLYKEYFWSVRTSNAKGPTWSFVAEQINRSSPPQTPAPGKEPSPPEAMPKPEPTTPPETSPQPEPTPKPIGKINLLEKEFTRQYDGGNVLWGRYDDRSIVITDSPSAALNTEKEWLYDLDYARINQLQWFVDAGSDGTNDIGIPENAVVTAEIEWESPDSGSIGGLTLGGIGFIDKDGYFHEFVGINDGDGGKGGYGELGAVARDYSRNARYSGEPWVFDSKQTATTGKAMLKLEREGSYVKMYINGKLVKEHNIRGKIAGIALGTSGHLDFPFGTIKVKSLKLIDSAAGTNKPPVAVLEVSKTEAFVGEKITLDATKSYDPDPDGHIKRYVWKMDGRQFAEENASLLEWSFELGEHELSLIVYDEGGESGSASTIMNIKPTKESLIAHPLIISSYQIVDQKGGDDLKKILLFFDAVGEEINFESRTVQINVLNPNSVEVTAKLLVEHPGLHTSLTKPDEIDFLEPTESVEQKIAPNSTGVFFLSIDGNFWEYLCEDYERCGVGYSLMPVEKSKLSIEEAIYLKYRPKVVTGDAGVFVLGPVKGVKVGTTLLRLRGTSLAGKLPKSLSGLERFFSVRIKLVSLKGVNIPKLFESYGATVTRAELKLIKETATPAGTHKFIQYVDDLNANGVEGVNTLVKKFVEQGIKGPRNENAVYQTRALLASTERSWQITKWAKSIFPEAKITVEEVITKNTEGFDVLVDFGNRVVSFEHKYHFPGSMIERAKQVFDHIKRLDKIAAARNIDSVEYVFISEKAEDYLLGGLLEKLLALLSVSSGVSANMEELYFIDELDSNNSCCDLKIFDILKMPYSAHLDGGSIRIQVPKQKNVIVVDSPSAPQKTQKEWLYDLDYARINQLQWFFDAGSDGTNDIGIPENAVVTAEIEWESPDSGSIGGLTLGGIGFIDEKSYFHDFVGFSDSNAVRGDYGALGAVARDYKRNSYYTGEQWAVEPKQTKTSGKANLKLERNGKHVKMYVNDKLLKEHDVQGSIAGIALGTSGHLHFPFGTITIKKLEMVS